MEVHVMFIATGLSCKDVQGSWYKRVFTSSNNHLVHSSEKMVREQKVERKVNDLAQNVRQVITAESQSARDTAHLYFPHMSPDVVVFKDAKEFSTQMSGLVHADNIAVVVSTTQLKQLTNVKASHFAVVDAVYVKKEDQFALGDRQVVCYGTGNYSTIEDKKMCSEKHVPPFRVNGRYCCWLSKIRDDTLLRDLRVPQAHDCATGFMKTRKDWYLSDIKYVPSWVSKQASRISTIGAWTQTQSLTIEEQLLACVRSFDLRITVDKQNEPCFHHGIVRILDSDAVYNTFHHFRDFLESHPDEFLYLLMILDDGSKGDKQVVFDELLGILGDTASTALAKDSDSLRVFDVRGKALVFTNCMKDTKEMISYYKTFETPCKGEKNRIVHSWEEILEIYLPCFPLEEDKNKLFVTQTHIQVDLKTIKESDKKKKGIRELTGKFNAKLLAWLMNPLTRNRKMNVIEFDYFKADYMQAFLTNLNVRFLK